MPDEPSMTFFEQERYKTMTELKVNLNSLGQQMDYRMKNVEELIREELEHVKNQELKEMKNFIRMLAEDIRIKNREQN